MSQRKLKKIRQEIKTVEEKAFEPVLNGQMQKGIFQILKENWKILLLVLVGTVLVYFNGLNANFVSDDYASITQNVDLKNAAFLLGGVNSTSISTYVLGNVFGVGSPIPFHVFNLFLLLITLTLVFVVIYKLFGDKVALLTTVIFAVLPIHVEAVTWISGKPYIFIAIYVLLAFLFFIRFRETGNKLFIILSFLSFVAGFLTDNPRPFSLFLIIFLYLITFGFKEFKKYLKYLPLVLVVIVIALVVAWPHIVYRINVVNSGYNASDSIFYSPFFQYPTGISKYLQLLWFPIDLTLYHTMYIFPWQLNWLILLTYLTAIGYFYFKNKAYFFALSFILAAVLPSIAPVKVSWLVAERYIFLGSLGFCMFMALLILDISRYWKPLLPIIMGIIVGCFGIRVILRNVDWQTNHNLWVNTCQVSPNSHNAWNNIGDDYDKLATAATTDKEKSIQYANSIKGFTQSTVIKSNYADAYHNRANIFFKIGRLDLARDSYQTALYYSPQLYQTYLSLTQIDLMQNNLQLAYSDASKALQIDPTNPQAAYVLAVVYAQSGNTAQAITMLKNIVVQAPSFTPAQQALTQLEAQLIK